MRKVSYNPLWKKLIDLRMTKTELQEEAGFSRSTLAKMRKNEHVALEVIERICSTLDCNVSDVISVLPANEASTAIRRVTDSYAGDDADQYRRRNHHEPIVTREVFNAANHLAASRTYGSRSKPLPVLSVVDNGVLRGYVPIDKDWRGFSTEDYRAACESVPTEEGEVLPTGKRLNMAGFQIVRSQFFPSTDDLNMTISQGNLRFSTSCLRKFEDVEYVELLLNTVKNCIAIRPCEKENPNAIHWGKLREEKWVVSSVGSRGLSKTLFDMMSWEDGAKYRFKGQFISNGDGKLLLFELDEPVVTRTETQVVVPEKPEESDEPKEEIVIKETIRSYPETWHNSFGTPISYISRVNVLEQVHYAGDWDVLRPATEIKEMNIFTADQIAELMHEAETIMEGWKAS